MPGWRAKGPQRGGDGLFAGEVLGQGMQREFLTAAAESGALRTSGLAATWAFIGIYLTQRPERMWLDSEALVSISPGLVPYRKAI